MTHIVKITQEGNRWRIEDRKKRWVQISEAADIKRGSITATTYGDKFPYSFEWCWLKCIADGKGDDIYHHAEWLGNEWSIFGACLNTKRKW